MTWATCFGPSALSRVRRCREFQARLHNETFSYHLHYHYHHRPTFDRALCLDCLDFPNPTSHLSRGLIRDVNLRFLL